ncbi:MAG: HpcH/HpaI aldolase/citrate lyase family protein [Halodesulfurarchaeum sp.]
MAQNSGERNDESGSEDRRPVERLTAGEPVAATWISLGEPAIAEIASELGFDLAFFDAEHTQFDLETVVHHVRALESAGSTASVLRVPSGDPTYLKRVLDIGLSGVMVPMVETAADAESVVEATTYPPDGRRGTGVARAQAYGESLGPYFESADEQLLRIPQIETTTAVENVEEIVAVDGIEALFLGPLDLSVSLGSIGDYHSEQWVESVETVLEASHDEDTPVGIIAGDEDELEYFHDLGFDWQIVGLDVGYLRAGATESLETYRSLGD